MYNALKKTSAFVGLVGLAILLKHPVIGGTVVCLGALFWPFFSLLDKKHTSKEQC